MLPHHSLSAGPESFQVILCHQETAHQESSLPKVAMTAPGSVIRSLPNAERLDRFFLEEETRTHLTALHMVPQHLLFCPPCPTSQSRASPPSAASLLYEGKHSPAQRQPQLMGDGKDTAILGDGDPPPLLPVPRSGAAESHCSGATAHQAGIAVAPHRGSATAPEPFSWWRCHGQGQAGWHWHHRLQGGEPGSCSFKERRGAAGGRKCKIGPVGRPAI